MTYFNYIEAEYAHQPGRPALNVAFRNLPVSRAGFYAWRKRATGQALSASAQRRADLLAKIIAIHKDDDAYGAPRITAELRAGGEQVSENTVAGIMAAHGVAGISPRTFHPPTTVADPSAFTPPDLIDRNFDQGHLDAVWLSDITYLTCGEGDVFLCAVRDGHSKRVLGWEAADHMRADLVVNCLEAAVECRGGRVDGVIFHADRGSQYTSGAVADFCRDHVIRQSVGRTGVCWDNAPSESFWSIFKHEYYYRHPFVTRAELYSAVDAWMIRYNNHRRNSTIGQISPLAYEHSTTQGLAA